MIATDKASFKTTKKGIFSNSLESCGTRNKREEKKELMKRGE
jgi:hypothetical protein